MPDRFCVASHLPKEVLTDNGTVFCLIEVQKGAGTVFRSGVPCEVEAPCLWIASVTEDYSFDGTEEWTLRALVLDGRVLESVYTDLPAEAALETWRRVAETSTVWTTSFSEYRELCDLCDALESLSDSEEGAFLALSYVWKMTAVLRRSAGAAGRGTPRALPSRRLTGTLRYMQENYGSKITLGDLAKTANMSVSNFSAVFRRAYGVSPMEYLLRFRLRHAAYLLQHTDEKIITVAEECGFFSNSNFIKAFTRMTGQTPSEYRKAAHMRRTGDLPEEF